MASCWDHHDSQTLMAFTTHHKFKTKIQVSIFPSRSSAEAGSQGPAGPWSIPCPVPMLTPNVPPSPVGGPPPSCATLPAASLVFLQILKLLVSLVLESFPQDVLSCLVQPPAPRGPPTHCSAAVGCSAPQGDGEGRCGCLALPPGIETRGVKMALEKPRPPPSPVTPSPPAAPPALPGRCLLFLTPLQCICAPSPCPNDGSKLGIPPVQPTLPRAPLCRGQS